MGKIFIVKKIWLFIFSLLFIVCVGCSSEQTNDNNFNDSFSDKKEESVIEPPLRRIHRKKKQEMTYFRMKRKIRTRYILGRRTAPRRKRMDRDLLNKRLSDYVLKI